MYQKYTRILAVLALSFVLVSSGSITNAASNDFDTRQYVRVSSDALNVGFVKGSVAEVSNAERGTYLEAVSITPPVSGNSASGSITIREVTWNKDWSDRCSNERFNSKDCTFSFDESTSRARLEIPSQERTYVVKTGQSISIPARNVMTPSANNNTGESGYYVLTLQNVNYAQNPMAEFRGTVQKSPGANAAPSSASQTSVSTSVSSVTAGTSSFALPARTTNTSQADYLTSIQNAYLKALGQLQTLGTQFSQKAGEITPSISDTTDAQAQTTTQRSAQYTAAYNQLTDIGVKIAALRAKIFGGDLSSTPSNTSNSQPQAQTGEQGCGLPNYEVVDGVQKYVGCSGYYGQGAGNKQVDVAAGYKGADPSNAWDGAYGHYDENGVFHSDMKYDRARDADPNVDVRAGQLGVDYCPLSNGFKTICSVSYYDPEGVKLTQTPFNPASILTIMDRFGIDREQLKDLEKGLEKKNIPHLPYEMYPGTGSDAGINLTDLANGGLGTAYDWRVDPLCQVKGPTACEQVKANAQLADKLDIEPTPGVTKTNATPLEVKLDDLKRQAVELMKKI